MPFLALLRRRPWHISVAAFGAGLALAERSVGSALLAAAALGGSLAAARAPRLAPCAAVLLLAGVAVGDLRLAAIDRPTQRVRDGDRVALRAYLLTLPRPGPFGSSAEVEVRNGALRGARLLARATIWSPLPRSIHVGDELVLSGSLRALRPASAAATPAGSSRDPPFDFAAYLRRRGVAAELLVDHSRRTGGRRGGLAGALDRMRERAERAVVAGMSADGAALLRGMVLGEDDQIDDATRDDWRDSGLAHLLSSYSMASTTF